MNQHDEIVDLTPAQIDFCSRHLNGFDQSTWQTTVAGKAGSDRSFLRVNSVGSTNNSWILILWDSHDSDWDRFLTLQEEMSQQSPLLPAIYAADEAHGLILEEDCGERTLKDFCRTIDNPKNIVGVYHQVCDALIAWQNIDPDTCANLTSRVLDREMFLWETDYFATHCVSEYFGLDSLLSSEWDHERNLLAEEAAALPLVCLHRDFQSENIMLYRDTIRFVDYQGARLGAAEYDIASLLFDPYISILNNEIRYGILDYYITKSKRAVTRETCHIAALQRLAQALGAYGNLSLHKGKDAYREYIQPALNTLCQVLKKVDRFPVMRTIVEECYERTME